MEWATHLQTKGPLNHASAQVHCQWCLVETPNDSSIVGKKEVDACVHTPLLNLDGSDSHVGSTRFVHHHQVKDHVVG